MSDLFMNMQRRRRAWHSHQPPADATSNTTTTTTRSPIKTRAATPARVINDINKNYLHNGDEDVDEDNFELDGDDDDDDNEGEGEDVQNHDTMNDDPLANILSLQLRKPSHWKWELTTSKSCSNIALPRIILYDHKGNLLVDAPAGGHGSSDQVYKQEDFEKPRPRDKTKKRPYNHQRAATTNLTHSVRKALEEEFDGLQIEEVTPTIATTNSAERKMQTSVLTTPSSTSTNTTMRSRRSRKPIELNTADLPDLSRRSSSLRGVRFQVEDENQSKIPDFLPTPPSTTTPTNSSSSGPREKRKYRRSQSSGRSSSRSESILERISSQKGRFSSPESEEEGLTEPGPRYFLRTDEAGTLMVHEDSFNSQNSRRHRRAQKYLSSAESINKSESPQSWTLAAPPVNNSGSPNTPSETSTTASTRERRRKLLPVRRYLSAGNILLNKHLSTSEEEEEVVPAVIVEKEEVDDMPAPSQGGRCNCKHHRRYRRNETKDLNPSISPAGQQRNGKIR